MWRHPCVTQHDRCLQTSTFFCLIILIRFSVISCRLALPRLRDHSNIIRLLASHNTQRQVQLINPTHLLTRTAYPIASHYNEHVYSNMAETNDKGNVQRWQSVHTELTDGRTDVITSHNIPVCDSHYKPGPLLPIIIYSNRYSTTGIDHWLLSIDHWLTSITIDDYSV